MKQELRCGFTTGTAVTAAALAVLLQRDFVEVILGNGDKLTIPIHELGADSAAVIKDAGDDPDVTHNALIRVHLRPASLEEATERDYCEENLIIRGGPGVGLVTRPGLAVPVGKWAINPGPRKMLRRNLSGLQGVWLLTIEIPGGEKLAAETLNPELGIVGGISILGNSGIVRPYSNAAYASTIVLQMKMLEVKQVVLTTGNRTSESSERDFPGIPVIRIGDFIKVALLSADKAGLERVIVCCMPGKLFKYSCGFENTHAHQAPMVLPDGYKTMGELELKVPPEEFKMILSDLKEKALEKLRQWCDNVEIAVYNREGTRLL